MKLTGFLGDSIIKSFVPSPNMYSPKYATKTNKITMRSKFEDKSLEKLKKVD